MTNNDIIEINSLEQLMEMSLAPAAQGHVDPRPKRERNMISREQIVKEQILRKLIRKKIQESFKKKPTEEQLLRATIRQIITEGDLSDIHPNRSTGINMLEDVLKKSIPTLRADFKRLTTDKSQRDSFRAHIVKAVKDAIMPEMVKGQYGIGSATGEASSLLSEPSPEGELEDPEEEDSAFAELEEAEVEIVDDEDKKIPVEDDDIPSETEDFGSGLEGMDETGRNMAYTSFRKISQYILDAYDSLANPKDKEIFLDYLVTNLKLYFDKFEDELASSVEEPTTSEYDNIKNT